MKKVWIEGANGHIGTALQKLLDAEKYELLLTDKNEVDITDQDQIHSYMVLTRPDVVINVASISDQRYCEVHPDEAYKVNAIGSRNLAVEAEEADCRVIFYSTKNVFEGRYQKPLTEFDELHPSTVYGKSKAAGERLLYRLSKHFVIIRSSWVYGTGHDFVDEVLKAAEEGKTLEVEDDYFSVPTSAHELARVFEYFIDHDNLGIYHAVCQGSCSRYEYARQILELTGHPNILKPVHGRQMHAESGYYVLDNTMLRLEGIPVPCEWQSALSDYLKGGYVID